MNASPDIEARLRAHLAAEREAIRPPADLEARVRRRLQESDATRTGSGVARQLLLAAALVLFAAGLAFGVARLRAIAPGPIKPNTTATPSFSARFSACIRRPSTPAWCPSGSQLRSASLASPTAGPPHHPDPATIASWTWVRRRRSSGATRATSMGADLDRGAGFTWIGTAAAGTSSMSAALRRRAHSPELAWTTSSRFRVAPASGRNQGFRRRLSAACRMAPPSTSWVVRHFRMASSGGCFRVRGGWSTTRSLVALVKRERSRWSAGCGR